MSTIRKTISISNKDKKLQEVINSVPNYEVSHVIRQLMYDGLKYRALVEKGLVDDVNVQINPQITENTIKNVQKQVEVEKIEQKQEKNEQNEPKMARIESKNELFDDFNKEIDFSDVELEEIDENDEDLEDLLLNNG